MYENHGKGRKKKREIKRGNIKREKKRESHVYPKRFQVKAVARITSNEFTEIQKTKININISPLIEENEEKDINR